MQSVSRAVKDDLEKPVQYEVNFIRNQQGHVITDRRFNTASLMAVYLGKDAISVNRVDWWGLSVLLCMRVLQLTCLVFCSICESAGQNYD